MAKLSSSINNLYRSALPLCERKGINLNIEQNDPSLSANCSARYLRAMLAQILHEAILRCQKGDEITIGAEQNDEQITVFIRDSGDSISRQQKALLESPGVKIRSRYGYGSTISIIL